MERVRRRADRLETIDRNEAKLPAMRGSIGRLSDVLRSGRARLKDHPLARLGPGLITGVADDDPSGIATYSQAGAQFGTAMLWTMPLAFPLMAAIQSMCGRIGRVTGRGLAANIKAEFPPHRSQGRRTALVDCKYNQYWR